MTGNKELFQSLEGAHQQIMRLGDGKALQVAGVVSVLFHSNTGKANLLTRVQYVPKLAHNLLSVGQLMSSGYSVVFTDNKCRITDKHANTLLVSIHMTPHRLFPLEVSDIGDVHAALCEVKSPNYGINVSVI